LFPPPRAREPPPSALAPDLLAAQNIAALLADGLVDELHLFVYPLTRGTGPRLFPEDAAPGNLSLAAGESYRTVWFTWPTDRRREAAASRSRTPTAASSRGG
jgi:dihydrofolate reductase